MNTAILTTSQRALVLRWTDDRIDMLDAKINNEEAAKHFFKADNIGYNDDQLKRLHDELRDLLELRRKLFD